MDASLAAAPRPPLRKRVKRTLRYGAIRVAAYFLSKIPARLASWMGAGFGVLAYGFAGTERKRALASLEIAFPAASHDERERLAKASFRHLGRCAFELVCVEQLDENVDAWVDWPKESRAVLEAALQRGKGVVFVSGHFGSWELLARRVALAGYSCQTIAKETSDPRLTALVEKFRASSGLKSIWRGRNGAAKDMLKALKANGILGLLIDQDTDVQSVWVPFFGRPAKTPRAAADLALRTGAALIVGFNPRGPDGKYHLAMEELVVPEGASTESITAALSERIERAIREHPEQWVWMHRRWRSLPPG